MSKQLVVTWEVVMRGFVKRTVTVPDDFDREKLDSGGSSESRLFRKLEDEALDSTDPSAMECEMSVYDIEERTP